jgi:radical SAM protein with 4Fe4S-binding SPASM domain
MTSWYVSPFWSYRPVDDQCVFTNWLTMRRMTASARRVEELEAIHRGTGAPPCGDTIAWARDLNIVFESAQHAEDYYTKLEREWEVALPGVDQIELTNRCPYTCKMCPRTESMDRSLGDMTLELFESTIRQISESQRYVALHHFGESLVYPKLVSAVRLARGYGMQTGLSCNPPSLPVALAAQLLDAGISNIVLSLDSLDSRVYQEIRGSAARLDVADRNLRELVRLRDAGAYETGITLQMINMRANQEEAERFLEYCAEIGVDRGVVVRLGRWDFEDSQLRVLGEFSTPGYYGYCSRPWKSVVVLWDGRVVPCCHDYNGVTVLGDLKVQTLAEVWNSSGAQGFRTHNRDFHLCTQCAFSRWYRGKQRDLEGFRHFHRDRTASGSRKEWLNLASLARWDTRHLFDEFDVLAR